MKDRIFSAALTALLSILYFCCLSGFIELLFRTADVHGIGNLIAAFLLALAALASVCLGGYSSKKIIRRKAKK